MEILRKITANQGMVLTNGDIYAKEVYLGVIDKPENWYEITEESYEAILKIEEEKEAELLYGMDEN